MFEIVYDPWDGERLTDEEACMYAFQLARDLRSHNTGEIVVKDVSNLIAIDSIRAAIKDEVLQYKKDVVLVWKNEVIEVDSDGRISSDLWHQDGFGNQGDFIVEILLDLND